MTRLERFLCGSLVLVLLATPSLGIAGTVCGTVTDELTGSPVDRAAVFLFDGSSYTGLHAGTDVAGAFCITDVPAGTYALQVRVDDYVTAVVHGVVVDGDVIGIGVDSAPLPRLRLAPPWPNPGRSEVFFRYGSESEAALRMQVVDPSGRIVRAWATSSATPGDRTLSWNFRDRSGQIVAPGIYFVRLTDGREAVSRRVLFLP